MMGSIRRFDRHNQQLLLDEGSIRPRAPSRSRSRSCGTNAANITACRARPRSLSTATNLVKRALASYTAGAILMPYDRFARAVEERAYDIEAVARTFGTSFEQTAHRFTTLGSGGAKRPDGPAFFFIRVDAAGNVRNGSMGRASPLPRTAAAALVECPQHLCHAVADRHAMARTARWPAVFLHRPHGGGGRRRL
jgi:predicted transcriptional regulator